MMKLINKQYVIRTLVFFFVFSFFTENCFSSTDTQSEVSGEIQNGFRVLTVPEKGTSVYFTVYRGDYIKVKFHPADERPLLEIPSLSISKKLAADLSNAPYFKMKKVGLYPFTVGSISGEIHVVEYAKLHYQALTADQANTFIAKNSPIILDVRTKREYRSGHLENSILIPIQELQQRYTELLQYKNQDVFIYCATGNRSAVASKILIDKGFIHIYNLRNGIYDWAKRGYPIIR